MGGGHHVVHPCRLFQPLLSCPSVFYALGLAVHIPPLVMNPPDDRSPPAFSASTPVVLRILPKAGSSAPIGYIYDPDPSRNEGKGGYLTLLLSSSPTKAMRFSGIFAPTSRRTARRGPPSGPHPHRGSQSSGILAPFFRRGHSWYVFYGRVPPRSPSCISSSI